ncbi:MAG: FAD-binding oxidoreductase [Ferrimicrobium sp.]|uniref:FAD-binding oxidoreductase n=1 Tax=Ferrimicrobium sp. TaxID=2926050 RepID=UPI00260BB195|nr:FAD-binding oxidoreductase [Ferrimicrobium sp.]
MTRPLDLPTSFADKVCVTDPDIIDQYCSDWTGRVIGTTDLLLRPSTHHEVAQLVQAARQHHATLLVQGGNTSLAGGSVPLAHEMLLTTKRLDTIAVDPASMTATVGAGVTLARLQTEIARYGFTFGVDIASRGSATLGGMTATNAGGIHVLRYGPMADNVVNLSCVFGDGSTIERRDTLLKDATGPSLQRLLIGSEGIFGVITSVTLRLRTQSPRRSVAITPLESIDEGVDISTLLRGKLASVNAIEYLGPEAIALAPSHPPWEHAVGGALLVEVLETASALADTLDNLKLHREWVIAETEREIQGLWSWREDIATWVARVGKPLKLDLAVPINRIGDLYRMAQMVAKDARIQCVCFGHLGDGNLHVNLVGDDHALEACSRAIYQATVDLGGSISAEHGIGTLKKEVLPLMRSASERHRLSQLIELFNPGRMINPNVMLNS